MLQVFLENIYTIPNKEESFMKICKYENKDNDEFGLSASNYSPYVQMIGLSSGFIKRQMESLAINLQTLGQRKLINKLDYNDTKIKEETQFALKQFFEALNNRDKDKLKQFTSDWMFSIMDQTDNDLKLLDSFNAKFKFNLKQITSSQIGTLKLFPDKTFLTFHFKLIGEVYVNNFKPDNREFQCSVVFQRNLNGDNWKVAYIDPSVFSFISIEALVPGF